MPITTCIFDAYGTLFDVTSAARRAAQEPEFPHLQDHWVTLAGHWRLKQLQYTWLRAITKAHTDFWIVTEESLDWALDACGLSGDPALRQRLLDLFWELQAYPEVPSVLKSLKEKGFNVAILSNGSPNMLAGAVDSAGVREVLDDVLSVESVGIFKPAHSVYDLVGQRFSCQKEEVLFVSSNGWDAAAAGGYGFTTAWVNRLNEPTDRLPWVPDYTLCNLNPIPDLADAQNG
ncbi:haloacid dehalogenase type II [Epibacterium sp. SM1979]|uniref:(S)-2-haloacid dehalogenase n=1 Tax=Tritonibacter litoralis TaxID=2662264 RepID=A0A843YD11_9RHOB|nr:haloacid dehalogenase type II [Tritonibacter litoralis]MQQ09240.1 haloacid dehalogenase type II [Tritonibacter litoralis]